MYGQDGERVSVFVEAVSGWNERRLSVGGPPPFKFSRCVVASAAAAAAATTAAAKAASQGGTCGSKADQQRGEEKNARRCHYRENTSEMKRHF